MKSGNLHFWTVDLGNDGQRLQLQFSTSQKTLNNNGLFEVESPAVPFNQLQLLINGTEMNNQTLISCSDDGADEVLQTKLYLYSKYIK